MWVIMQTGYRRKDGSTQDYGTSPHSPTRRLVAAFRIEVAMLSWLDRLEQWAAEDVGPSDQDRLIPTYEVIKVRRLPDLDAARYVGRQYYRDHGRAESLRKMVLDVRASHAELRQTLQRRSSRTRHEPT
jgi:hypothetical protein